MALSTSLRGNCRLQMADRRRIDSSTGLTFYSLEQGPLFLIISGTFRLRTETSIAVAALDPTAVGICSVD